MNDWLDYKGSGQHPEENNRSGSRFYRYSQKKEIIQNGINSAR